MISLEFVVPMGDTISNPKPDSVRKLVLHAGREFWSIGAGDAGLSYKNPALSISTSLRIVFHEKHGFYLEYWNSNRERFVSLGDGDFEHVVTVYVGGNPTHYPSKFFISRDQALIAVERFLADGQMSDEVTWARRKEIQWEPPAGYLY